jgi:hypothetical protein
LGEEPDELDFVVFDFAIVLCNPPFLIRSQLLEWGEFSNGRVGVSSIRFADGADLAMELSSVYEANFHARSHPIRKASRITPPMA